jgi:hypothetical protein
MITAVTTRRADCTLLVAFVFAVAVAAGLGLLPSGTESVSTRSTAGSAVVIETTSESLLEYEGPSVLIPLSVPVALAGVALARRTRRTSRTTGLLCLAGCVLGMMSIGLFFLPVPILLLLAARWQSPVPSARVGA